MNKVIIDVCDQDFQELVLERSHQKLVVVDFWANWCAPCRSLKPVLEKIAKDYKGAFILAKLDTESNKKIPETYHIRGIPDVKFFKDGAVVDGFTGMIQESAIRDRLAKYICDPLTDFLEKVSSSENPLRDYQDKEPMFGGESAFKIAYAKVLLQENDDHKAEKLLGEIDELDKFYQEAKNIQLLIHLEQNSNQNVQTETDRMFLQATRQLLNGKIIEAIENLLKVLEADRDYKDGLGKKTMVAAISQCEDSQLANRYRRRFSMLMNV